jgi:repressor LexA
VLRVRGDSMIDEQIRDGDQIVVERAHEARKGEMVVALVRGSEATLKRFYRKGPKVVLEPANPAYRPLELPASEVEIRGIVRGLLRSY